MNKTKREKRDKALSKSVRRSKAQLRADAILMFNKGSSAAEVADLLGVSRQSVYNWVNRYRSRTNQDLSARLSDAERSGRPKIADGKIDHWIAKVIDCAPSSYGYYATEWTTELLRVFLRDFHGIECSRNTVRRSISRLRFDETLITETPPLCYSYSRIGEQKRIPITGNRRKRIIHGVINIKTGDVELLITKLWIQETHQDFLQLIRSHWRGWNIILFEDRGAPHTSEDSRELAKRLGIELRFLPKATPELNPMDHLFRFGKKDTQANRLSHDVSEVVLSACRYIIDMSPHERLTIAGIYSGSSWLDN